MQVTDIGNKEDGKIWHRKPTSAKGLMVTVVRTVQQAKTVRFLHVAFDTTGESFIAGDHHGNIYVLDIGRNRFRLVQKTGQACTALAFTLRRTTEFLVALADYTVKCFDKGGPSTTYNELPAGLNRKRLVALLKAFGEYPAKYRMFVWRSLLFLPENYAAYSSLTDKGLHTAYLALGDKYPIKSQKLQRGLQRVLSALAHWAAIFGEVEYLPLVAFPFVKLFQNNPMLCFEVVATIIVNWCQHWFEYFPNPPLNILSMVENVLAHHDKELLQHLVDCGITSQLYVWPLLETLFSEVLTRDEWLRLFDNIFTNHPSFLLMTCVAYITCSREPLLQCAQKQDFEYFFHHRNNLDVGAMIKEAYRLMSNTPADIHPKKILSDFSPLTQGQYPIFNQYPEFIVEYQSREREKIRLQEMEYLRERQELSAMHAEFVRRQAEEETYYAQQELLQKTEEQRRNILAQEEEKLTEQRAKLAAMKRELKVKELQLLDASRRRFLKHQQEVKASQIEKLDKEINRKMDLRDQETAVAIEDLEVRQMELEAQRRRLEEVSNLFILLVIPINCFVCFHLLKEQDQTEQRVGDEVNIRLRKAERENESIAQQLHKPNKNIQVMHVTTNHVFFFGHYSIIQRNHVDQMEGLS
uniref:TBC1 domain family member 31 n=1 Tax=Neogobius melanostomus TaxID=47308 RepID=A0A8C6SLX1_9GOBI